MVQCNTALPRAKLHWHIAWTKVRRRVNLRIIQVQTVRHSVIGMTKGLGKVLGLKSEEDKIWHMCEAGLAVKGLKNIFKPPVGY